MKKTEDLFKEYSPRLKSFIRKRVTNKDDADDILQDVFYQLTQANNLLNPIEQVAAWLYQVTRNIIINKGIKKREEPIPSIPNNEDDPLSEFSEILFNDSSIKTPETEYLHSMVWIELENALSELPSEQREVFEMTELEGLSIKDISKKTGINSNTILSRKRYAILHLRQRLAQLYSEIISY